MKLGTRRDIILACLGLGAAACLACTLIYDPSPLTKLTFGVFGLAVGALVLSRKPLVTGLSVVAIGLIFVLVGLRVHLRASAGFPVSGPLPPAWRDFDELQAIQAFLLSIWRKIAGH